MPNVFEPFDVTYALVTEQMRERADSSERSEREWVMALIEEFREERNVWETSAVLHDYVEGSQRLRARYLRLVAGAYLHISYDLPRVIANNWPGGPCFPAQPDKHQATVLYLRLASVFPDVMKDVMKNSLVVGLLLSTISKLFRLDDMIKVPAQWMQRLRSDAWIHADILQGSPNRAQIEQRMIFAMQRALRDVSNLRPWTYAGLSPPAYGAYFRFGSQFSLNLIVFYLVYSCW
jgi:hypothetical protein